MALPLTSRGRALLDGLNDRGELNPGRLTEDVRLRDVIRAHPGLLCKALNVRQDHGMEAPEQIHPSA
jgi:hypothetical protein